MTEIIFLLVQFSFLESDCWESQFDPPQKVLSNWKGCSSPFIQKVALAGFGNIQQEEKTGGMKLQG